MKLSYARSAGTFVELIDLENFEGDVIAFVQFKKYTLILKCKHLEILMQVLNVDGIKIGNTIFILPTTKFSSTSKYCHMVCYTSP